MLQDRDRKGKPNKQGTESCHGAALGEDEVALTREALQWPHAPRCARGHSRGWDCRAAGAEQEAVWQSRFDAYRGSHPDLADELLRRLRAITRQF